MSSNWIFLPPYNSFVIADPFDWLVLVAFLITSGRLLIEAHGDG